MSTESIEKKARDHLILRPFTKRKDTIQYSFGNVYLLAEQRLKWNVVRQNGNNFLSLIEQIRFVIGNIQKN